MDTDLTNNLILIWINTDTTLLSFRT